MRFTTFHTLSLAFLLHASLASAATYYVAASGSDENDGLGEASPWESLQHAATQVKGGDTVLIAPGDYAGFTHSTDSGHASGTEGALITYQATGPGVKIVTGVPNGIPTGTPGGGGIYGIQILNADYIVLDGFEVSGMNRAGIGVEESHHVTVRNCTATRNGRWGIFTSFADYCTIEHNLCAFSEREHGIYYSNSSKGAVIRHNISHSNTRAGIHMNGDRFFEPKVRDDIEVTGVIEGAEIYGNIIYSTGSGGGAALNMDGVQHAVIYNNLLYAAHAGGITCYGIDGAVPSQYPVIVNNTIIMASDGRSTIQLADHTDFPTGAIGAQIYNNILIHLGGRANIEAHEKSLEGLSTGNNIVTNRFEAAGTVVTLAEWQNRGFGQSSKLAGDLQELFADQPANDYRLKSGSLAVDVGADWIPGLVLTDLDENDRPSGLGYDAGAYELQQTATGQWGGYDIFHGQVSADEWLGRAYISSAPWIFSYRFLSWLYLEEASIEPAGAWAYSPR